MKRHALGSWHTKSGNVVEAFLEPGPGPTRELTMEWSTFPPADGDWAEYIGEILPAISARACEYLEITGPVLGVVG